MKGFKTGVAGVIMLIACIMMGLYHIWTAILAFTNFGAVWGFVAFCAPVASELFLNGVYIGELGFFNTYTLALITIFVLYGIAALVHPKEKAEQ